MAAATPRQRGPEPGKLEVPAAEEGTGVGEVFGTILVKEPTITWFGGQYTVAITTKGGKK